MRLLSLQIGRISSYPVPDTDEPGQVFSSGIGKRPVPGPVALARLGLAGDEIADLRVHGGPDQAVLAYAAAHYPLWAVEWDRPEPPPGSFGENMTVEGADETTVCVGDRWRIGEAVLEVSKPRSPCNHLAWYQQREDLVARVRQTGRSGWYLRVIAEGDLEPGVAIELLARPYPALNVRRVAVAMANRHRDHAEAMLLVHCEALAQDWRLRLAREGFRRSGGADASRPN